MSAVLQKATQDFKAGRLSAAIQGCKKVLAGSPDLAEAHYLLGLFVWQGGDALGGLPSLERACRLSPRRAGYQSTRGAALVDAGRVEEGVAALKTATELDPDSFDAWKNLGMAAQRARRWDLAASSLSRAIRARPEPGLRLRLGEVLIEKGDFKAALQVLQELGRSQAASPPTAGPPSVQPARFYAALATAHFGLSDLEAAESAWTEALRQEPGRVDWRRSLAILRFQLWRYAEAALDWRMVLEQLAASPDGPVLEATTGLAVALNRLGQADEARSLLLPMRERGRKDATFVEILSTLSDTAVLQEQVIPDLLALIEGGDPRRPELLHALGKIYEKLRRYDDAFAAHQLCNEVRGHHNDIAENARLLTRIQRAYSSGFPERLPRAAIKPGPRPIFIVGMPRSGSSMTEQILDSHPLVWGGGERKELAAALSRIHPSFPEGISKAGQALIQKEADTLRGRWAALSDGRPVITDKMLSNSLLVGLIIQLFPDARIVSTVRNPLDTCLSIYFSFLAEQASADTTLYGIGAYHREHLRLMAHWKQVSPIPIIEVVYEEMVADLEGGARELLGALNLPFDKACLRFHENTRIVNTASYDQVRRPLYNQSVGRAERLYGTHLGPLRAGLAGEPPPPERG